MRAGLSSFLLIIVTFCLQSQTTVQLERADALSRTEIDGQQVQKLIGNVWLVQQNTNIYCDSAYLYTQTNSAIAFGNVHIIDEVDSIDLYGDYLEYSGNTRIAHVRENVVLKDVTGDLYTNYLDYNRDTKVGYYYNGGKLIDSANVLTSKRGFYNSETKQAQFLDSVYLDNPDYQLWTDTLNYSTEIKEALSEGYTLGISAEGDTLISKKGALFKSNDRYTEIYEGFVKTSEYRIRGDTVIADDSRSEYSAHFNVKMTAFADSVDIYGDRVYYNKASKTARACQNSYLRKLVNGDSLFIKGDTLISVQNEEANEKYLTAYHQVQMYKSDLQGMADSVSYNFSDSTIYMYQSPILWNVDSQINADSIDIHLADNKIDRMNLKQNSFVISQDSLKNFNQVKGRDMLVYFNEGYITRADVFGNGQSIYFAIDAQNGSSTMNKVECSNMGLYFENNAVSELRMYREVDGSLIPPQEIKAPDTRLRGFDWRIDQRPKLTDVARHLRFDR